MNLQTEKKSRPRKFPGDRGGGCAFETLTIASNLEAKAEGVYERGSVLRLGASVDKNG